MSSRPSPGRPGPRAQKKSPAVEWTAGIVAMPAYVSDKATPYRPMVLLFMGADGAILGSHAAHPEEALGIASASLQATIEQPVIGKPHTPSRVRVATPELATALREGHPTLDIVCAPTPELDAMVATMQQHMSEDAAYLEQPSYLSSGVEPDAIAAFCGAAAELYRVKPWKVVPGDECIFALSIPGLGLHDAVVSIIGQSGQSYGLIFFAGLADFEQYLCLAEAMDAGEDPEVPPHLALNFVPEHELPAPALDELREHGWRVASKAAYPWLVAVDAALVMRSPAAD